MFVDARRLDNDALIKADVCIIGGGIAGITLALELGKRSIRTCVLESGGFRPDRATRDLNRGENVGLPYRFDDGSRSRFLGGSSNCWGGWCRPMDEHDFAPRDWVPYSGWPFPKAELLPYYDRSREILKIGPDRYDVEYWVRAVARADVRRLPLVTGRVVDAVSQFSPRLRFGKFYRKDLASSPHITVFLYANAVEIETDATGCKIQAVKWATLTKRTAKASAKMFVIAAGGIENPRILLASNRTHPAGIGNHKDLVGRFFMDHPQAFLGHVELFGDWKHNKLYDDRFNYHNPAVSAHGICIAAQLLLSPDVQTREKLLNSQVWFESIFYSESSDAAKALARLRRRILQKEAPGRGSVGRDLLTWLAHPMSGAGFAVNSVLRRRSAVCGNRLRLIVEPDPDPESRIMLSEQRDRLGMNRVRVQWRLGSLVRHTFDRTCALVAQEISRAGVGDISLDPPIGDDAWPDGFSEEGTWHHMGTTRMHDSPEFGVVDRNCRVHEIKNLYVAGSSVFPTAGGNFPTITIVALALRLSDHIAKELSPPIGLASSSQPRAR
jgi:choline dehydrogenase-like flavoprotein